MTLRRDTGKTAKAAKWLVVGLTALGLVALLASGSSAAVNTFTTVADTYVNVAYPTSNFGNKPEVKVDDNPKIGYLKFDVTGTSGTITSAKLKVFSKTASNAITVRSVANTSGSETGITYNTRPAVGTLPATC